MCRRCASAESRPGNRRPWPYAERKFKIGQARAKAERPKRRGGEAGYSRVPGQGDFGQFRRRGPTRLGRLQRRSGVYCARSWAVGTGRSRRRSIPAGAARRAASSSAGPTMTCTTRRSEMLGRKLVTHQTGPEGKIVQRVYIEVAEQFEREIYFGFVLDRKVERVRIIASRFGGMEIEEIAKDRPEEILQVVVEPAVGLQSFQAREIAFGLGLNLKQVSRAVADDARRLSRLPRSGRDDGRNQSAGGDQGRSRDRSRRQDVLRRQRPVPPQQRRRHARSFAGRPARGEAAEHNLNYVGLDGDIGCIINGAGPRHGDDGHDQICGRRARQLPRRRRRRFARASRGGVQASCCRTATSRRSWSTSSPASTAATGLPRA